ncbi:MAG: hypothetical protein HY593_03905, partial [Candidatus Omnitrophica bacterium]|nr:hypothetical protein [Candidatus Omnitrophota bacterium]
GLFELAIRSFDEQGREEKGLRIERLRFTKEGGLRNVEFIQDGLRVTSLTQSFGKDKSGQDVVTTYFNKGAIDANGQIIRENVIGVSIRAASGAQFVTVLRANQEFFNRLANALGEFAVKHGLLNLEIQFEKFFVKGVLRAETGKFETGAGIFLPTAIAKTPAELVIHQVVTDAAGKTKVVQDLTNAQIDQIKSLIRSPFVTAEKGAEVLSSTLAAFAVKNQLNLSFTIQGLLDVQIGDRGKTFAVTAFTPQGTAFTASGVLEGKDRAFTASFFAKAFQEAQARASKFDRLLSLGFSAQQALAESLTGDIRSKLGTVLQINLISAVNKIQGAVTFDPSGQVRKIQASFRGGFNVEIDRVQADLTAKNILSALRSLTGGAIAVEQGVARGLAAQAAVATALPRLTIQPGVGIVRYGLSSRAYPGTLQPGEVPGAAPQAYVTLGITGKVERIELGPKITLAGELLTKLTPEMILPLWRAGEEAQVGVTAAIEKGIAKGLSPAAAWKQAISGGVQTKVGVEGVQIQVAGPVKGTEVVLTMGIRGEAVEARILGETAGKTGYFVQLSRREMGKLSISEIVGRVGFAQLTAERFEQNIARGMPAKEALHKAALAGPPSLISPKEFLISVSSRQHGIEGIVAGLHGVTASQVTYLNKQGEKVVSIKQRGGLTEAVGNAAKGTLVKGSLEYNDVTKQIVKAEGSILQKVRHSGLDGMVVMNYQNNKLVSADLLVGGENAHLTSAKDGFLYATDAAGKRISLDLGPRLILNAADEGILTKNVRIDGLTASGQLFGHYEVKGADNRVVTPLPLPGVVGEGPAAKPEGLVTRAQVKDVVLGGETRQVFTNGTVAFMGDQVVYNTPGSQLTILGPTSNVLPGGLMVYSGMVTFTATGIDFSNGTKADIVKGITGTYSVELKGFMVDPGQEKAVGNFLGRDYTGVSLSAMSAAERLDLGNALLILAQGQKNLPEIMKALGPEASALMRIYLETTAQKAGAGDLKSDAFKGAIANIYLINTAVQIQALRTNESFQSRLGKEGARISGLMEQYIAAVKGGDLKSASDILIGKPEAAKEEFAKTGSVKLETLGLNMVLQFVRMGELKNEASIKVLTGEAQSKVHSLIDQISKAAGEGSFAQAFKLYIGDMKAAQEELAATGSVKLETLGLNVTLQLIRAGELKNNVVFQAQLSGANKPLVNGLIDRIASAAVKGDFASAFKSFVGDPAADSMIGKIGLNAILTLADKGVLGSGGIQLDKMTDMTLLVTLLDPKYANAKLEVKDDKVHLSVDVSKNVTQVEVYGLEGNKLAAPTEIRLYRDGSNKEKADIVAVFDPSGKLTKVEGLGKEGSKWMLMNGQNFWVSPTTDGKQLIFQTRDGEYLKGEFKGGALSAEGSTTYLELLASGDFKVLSRIGFKREVPANEYRLEFNSTLRLDGKGGFSIVHGWVTFKDKKIETKADNKIYGAGVGGDPDAPPIPSEAPVLKGKVKEENGKFVITEGTWTVAANEIVFALGQKFELTTVSEIFKVGGSAFRAEKLSIVIAKNEQGEAGVFRLNAWEDKVKQKIKSHEDLSDTLDVKSRHRWEISGSLWDLKTAYEKGDVLGVEHALSKLSTIQNTYTEASHWTERSAQLINLGALVDDSGVLVTSVEALKTSKVDVDKTFAALYEKMENGAALPKRLLHPEGLGPKTVYGYVTRDVTRILAPALEARAAYREEHLEDIMEEAELGERAKAWFTAKAIRSMGEEAASQIGYFTWAWEMPKAAGFTVLKSFANTLMWAGVNGGENLRSLVWDGEFKHYGWGSESRERHSDNMKLLAERAEKGDLVARVGYEFVAGVDMGKYALSIVHPAGILIALFLPELEVNYSKTGMLGWAGEGANDAAVVLKFAMSLGRGPYALLYRGMEGGLAAASKTIAGLSWQGIKAASQAAVSSVGTFFKASSHALRAAPAQFTGTLAAIGARYDALVGSLVARVSTAVNRAALGIGNFLKVSVPNGLTAARNFVITLPPKVTAGLAAIGARYDALVGNLVTRVSTAAGLIKGVPGAAANSFRGLVHGWRGFGQAAYSSSQAYRTALNVGSNLRAAADVPLKALTTPVSREAIVSMTRSGYETGLVWIRLDLVVTMAGHAYQSITADRKFDAQAVWQEAKANALGGFAAGAVFGTVFKTAGLMVKAAQEGKAAADVLNKIADSYKTLAANTGFASPQTAFVMAASVTTNVAVDLAYGEVRSGWDLLGSAVR